MEKYENETIAAIATALSDSGIGIVRISGENAIYIIDNIFRSAAGRRILTKVQSHTIHYGYIVDSDENIIDEVMVAVMKAPRSYTTEDTVEINCHGGVLVMQKVLEAVLHAGARLAQPGEFTKRAFLNGRIDLSRAEAVIDVIHSQNEYALSSSVSQLKGQLSNKIHTLREDILYQIAFIESALDDPEHISLDGYPEQLAAKVTYFQQEIAKLLDTADNGRLIKEGISTVIVGKPNAGKSSLLNMLLGEDRAIVTEIAGTTRDALHETINLHGISLNMIDTAGIHETQDVVEKIGVERAKKYAMDADLILYVVDASGNIDEDDQNIISLLDGKKAIILLNKSDLAEDKQNDAWAEYFKKKGFAVVKVNSKKGGGIKSIQGVIQEACKEKTERDRKRGILNRPVRAMVVGIPNVGKSTFINSLAGKACAKTGNKPGVTKGKQWIRLNKNVELLDTPGILWPKFEDQMVGLRLAFIGSIKDEILNTEELAAELIQFMKKHYVGVLAEKYDIAENEDPYACLADVAKNRHCLLRGSELDTNKAAMLLIDDFRNGRLGKITLEFPEDYK